MIDKVILGLGLPIEILILSLAPFMYLWRSISFNYSTKIHIGYKEGDKKWKIYLIT